MACYDLKYSTSTWHERYCAPRTSPHALKAMQLSSFLGCSFVYRPLVPLTLAWIPNYVEHQTLLYISSTKLYIPRWCDSMLWRWLSFPCSAISRQQMIVCTGQSPSLITHKPQTDVLIVSKHEKRPMKSHKTLRQWAHWIKSPICPKEKKFSMISCWVGL